MQARCYGRFAVVLRRGFVGVAIAFRSFVRCGGACVRRASRHLRLQSRDSPTRRALTIATSPGTATAHRAPASTNGALPVPAGPAARPFVKWAGGKTQILDELVRRAPRSIATYYEPFVGGGALFFRLAADPERRPRRAVLNDLSRELIDTYEVVRDALAPLLERLERLQRDYLAADDEARAAYYYEVRAETPATPVEIAARLLFLNKTCFNGLYRVNRRGGFNVPHGRYRKPRILDAAALEAASAVLQDVELLSVDFEQACAAAGPGDFVYLDPPFYPLSDTSRFTAYTEGSFDRDDQLRLKWRIDALRERGVPVMLSNSPHQWVLGLYDGGRYFIDRVPARRAINSRGEGRGVVDELTVTSYEPPAEG